MKRVDHRPQIVGPSEFTAKHVKRIQAIAIQLQGFHGELLNMRMALTAARIGPVLDKLGYELCDRMGESGLVGTEERKAQRRRAGFARQAERERRQRIAKEEREIREALGRAKKRRARR